MSDASAHLSSAEAAVAEFFGSLPADQFTLRVGEAWTPAEHLSHLNTAVSAVARGFGINRWLLRLRFGRARHPSRSYEEVREFYRTKLAGGAVARGGFVPAPENLAAADCEPRRAELLARWERVNNRLRRALAGWPERDLDRLQLPHPLLGKLTAREMLFFSAYHAHHHIAAARKRLPS